MIFVTLFKEKIIKNPFFAGSLVMVLGSNIFNAGQFIYHLLTVKFLSNFYGETLAKIYYGDIAAMLSFLGIASLIQLSLGLTIVKFIASQKSQEKIANFSKWIMYWTVMAGLVICVLTLLVSPFLIKFLNISQPLAFYLLGPILLFYILINSGRSILQGLLQFPKYVLSLLSEVGSNIICLVVLMYAGFAVFGAILSILLGVFFSFLITRVAISKLLSGPKGPKPEIAPLLKYSFPVLLQGLALTSMYTTDLLLVKHFFSPEQAGLYAALAVLGRVVFFGTSPVTHVMFPMIAKRHSHGEAYHNIFYLSVFLVLLVGAAITLFYYLFPQIPLVVLYKEGFLEGSSLLWWFGLFMGLLAVAMLFVQFYLSVGKTKVVGLFLGAAFIQTLLIWFIHTSLLTVIQLSIASVALLVLALFIYFPYHDSPSRWRFGGANK